LGNDREIIVKELRNLTVEELAKYPEAVHRGEGSEEWRENRLDSEVSLTCWLRVRTSIPVPEILHRPAQDSDFRFYVMGKLPGSVLLNVFGSFGILDRLR
jgi:hypothetical protein